MASYPAVKWINGALTILDIPATATYAVPTCLSDDGSIIYGYANPGDSILLGAYRWDGTAATRLFDINGEWQTPRACSSDGSVIAGVTNVGLSGDMLVWTSGGTAGVVATPGATYTDANVVQTSPAGLITPSGVLIAGQSSKTGDSQATTFTSLGAPTLLTLAVPLTSQSQGYSTSDDGATVVGVATHSLTPGSIPIIWLSGAGNGLNCTPGSISAGIAQYVQANGAVVFGSLGSGDQGCYWDNLSAVDGTTGFLGDVHMLDLLAGGSFTEVQDCARSPASSPVCVGIADDASSSWAVRWTGTTAQKLVGLPGGTFSAAAACSADGGVVVGYADDSDGNRRAVYWDAAGTIHRLAEPAGTTESDAIWVSPDGASMIGVIVFDTPPATAKVAELFFTPTASFVDLTVTANREKFRTADGATPDLGYRGINPLGMVPSVMLRAEGTDAAAFATNDGFGGTFAVSGGSLALAGSRPPCSETVVLAPEVQGADPLIILSVSDDGGRTFSLQRKARSIGRLGEYLKRIRWLKMGQFRQRIIQLEITDPVRRNIVGFYTDVQKGMD